MLFDTTFLIDLEREARKGKARSATRFLLNHPDVALYISVITVAESGEGFAEEEEENCREALRPYTVIPLNWEIGWNAGQISRVLRNDDIMSVVCMQIGHDIPTRGARYFSQPKTPQDAEHRQPEFSARPASARVVLTHL